MVFEVQQLEWFRPDGTLLPCLVSLFGRLRVWAFPVMESGTLTIRWDAYQAAIAEAKASAVWFASPQSASQHQ